MRTRDGCAGHAGIGGEARAAALALLDRLGPALDRVRTGGPADAHADAHADAGCAVCPVCAVIAVVRREHPELAARLAEQAMAVLAVLRTALEEGDPAADPAADTTAAPTAGTTPPGDPGPAARRVQRIRIDRPRAAP
ncbi:MAG TPA: hypothetical protein VEZ42_03655 [Pseudonocardia sp.]|nr:hypothetical protein [Pseudonocardia sp.]